MNWKDTSDVGEHACHTSTPETGKEALTVETSPVSTDGLVAKVLVTQARGPEVEFLEPIMQPHSVVYVCDTGIRTGR